MAQPGPWLEIGALGSLGGGLAGVGGGAAGWVTGGMNSGTGCGVAGAGGGGAASDGAGVSATRAAGREGARAIRVAAGREGGACVAGASAAGAGTGGVAAAAAGDGAVAAAVAGAATVATVAGRGVGWGCGRLLTITSTARPAAATPIAAAAGSQRIGEAPAGLRAGGRIQLSSSSSGAGGWTSRVETVNGGRSGDGGGSATNGSGGGWDCGGGAAVAGFGAGRAKGRAEPDRMAAVELGVRSGGGSGLAASVVDFTLSGRLGIEGQALGRA